MKNIDNIRQMNSEEVAKLINREARCGCCAYHGEICASTSCDCLIGIKSWLEAEAEPLLTDDELVILKNMNKNYKWMARDKNNTLCVYWAKPHKNGDEWTEWTVKKHSQSLYLFEHLFKFVKWLDAEPYEISQLLGE